MLESKVRNRNKPFDFVSAAGREKNPTNHKKSHSKPDWARSRWKRESLLPYRLVSQPVSQAGRQTEVRVLLFLLCFSLMASACLNHSSPRQEPGPGMNSPFRSETEHRAHLVSLMCCMGQCCCFFHTLCFVCARSLRRGVLVQEPCGNADLSRVEAVWDVTSVPELREQRFPPCCSEWAWPYRLLMLLMESVLVLGAEDPGSRVSQMETRGSCGTVWVTAAVAEAWILLCFHRGCSTPRVRDMAKTSKIWSCKHFCLHGTEFGMFCSFPFNCIHAFYDFTSIIGCKPSSLLW